MVSKKCPKLERQSHGLAPFVGSASDKPGFSPEFLVCTESTHGRLIMPHEPCYPLGTAKIEQ